MTLSNDEDALVRRRLVSAGLEHRLDERWALQLGVGASLGGDVTVAEDRYELGPGWLASAGASFRILEGTGIEPFLLVSLGLGAGMARAERDDEEAWFTALDARLSLTVGKLFWNALAPYGVARLFGAPAIWERAGETVTGQDDYHVQLGLGLLAAAGGLAGAFVEVIPLGERAVTVGASASF